MHGRLHWAIRGSGGPCRRSEPSRGSRISLAGRWSCPVLGVRPGVRWCRGSRGSGKAKARAHVQSDVGPGSQHTVSEMPGSALGSRHEKAVGSTPEDRAGEFASRSRRTFLLHPVSACTCTGNGSGLSSSFAVIMILFFCF